MVFSLFFLQTQFAALVRTASLNLCFSAKIKKNNIHVNPKNPIFPYMKCSFFSRMAISWTCKLNGQHWNDICQRYYCFRKVTHLDKGYTSGCFIHMAVEMRQGLSTCASLYTIGNRSPTLQHSKKQMGVPVAMQQSWQNLVRLIFNFGGNVWHDFSFYWLGC